MKRIDGSLFFWVPVIVYILYMIVLNMYTPAVKTFLAIITMFLIVQHIIAIIYFLIEKCWEKSVNDTTGPDLFKFCYKYSIIHVLVLLTRFLNKHLTIKI